MVLCIIVWYYFSSHKHPPTKDENIGFSFQYLPFPAPARYSKKEGITHSFLGKEGRWQMGSTIYGT